MYDLPERNASRALRPDSVCRSEKVTAMILDFPETKRDAEKQRRRRLDRVARE